MSGVGIACLTMVTSRLRQTERDAQPGENKNRSPPVGTSGVGPVVPPQFAAMEIATHFPDGDVVVFAIRQLCNGSRLVVAHPRRRLLCGRGHSSERGSEVLFAGGPDPASQHTAVLCTARAGYSSSSKPLRSSEGTVASGEEDVNCENGGQRGKAKGKGEEGRGKREKGGGEGAHRFRIKSSFPISTVQI